MITAVFSLVSAAITGYVAYLMAKLKQQGAAAALKDDENLRITKEIDKTSAMTHKLVNSASLAQLKLYVLAVYQIAALTKKPEDIETAEKASKLLENMTRKQTNEYKKTE
jgi:hypothetical protein